MVSDGDLIGRRGDHRREWWLEMLAQAGSPGAGFSRESFERPVHEVMTSPLITVAHTAPVQVIAEALQAHRVKRLPVLNEGRLIGVVSRADLLRVVESVPLARLAGENDGGGLLGFLESLIGGASLRGERERRAPRGEEKRAHSILSAAAFRERSAPTRLRPSSRSRLISGSAARTPAPDQGSPRLSRRRGIVARTAPSRRARGNHRRAGVDAAAFSLRSLQRRRAKNRRR